MHNIPVTKLKKGHKAKIVEILCAKKDEHRVCALGLRVGSTVTRFSSFALKGPVTIKVGTTTVALGHGVAEKIIVEPV